MRTQFNPKPSAEQEREREEWRERPILSVRSECHANLEMQNESVPTEEGREGGRRVGC